MEGGGVGSAGYKGRAKGGNHSLKNQKGCSDKQPFWFFALKPMT
jgi:hypothetical protein